MCSGCSDVFLCTGAEDRTHECPREAPWAGCTWPREGPPSAKRGPNQRQKITKVRSLVFLNTDSVPGNLLDVFTYMTSFNPYNSPRRWQHPILQMRLREIWKAGSSVSSPGLSVFKAQSGGPTSLHPVVMAYLPSALASGSPGQWKALEDLWERGQRPLRLKPRDSELAARSALLTTAVWHGGKGAGRVRSWSLEAQPLLVLSQVTRSPGPSSLPTGLVPWAHENTTQRGAGLVPYLKPATAPHSPLRREYWVMAG